MPTNKDIQTDGHDVVADEDGAIAVNSASGERVRQALQFNINLTRADGGGDEANKESEIEVIVSTRDRDRYNTEVVGLKLDRFKKNPVVTWNHDYYLPPIARCMRIGLDSLKRTVAQPRFVPGDIFPFAQQVKAQVKGGFLHTASIGFIPHKRQILEDKEAAPNPDGSAPRYIRYTDNELLEFAFVTVPGNPNCTVLGRSLGLLDDAAARAMDPAANEELYRTILFGGSEDRHVKACAEAQRWVRSLGDDLEFVAEYRYDKHSSCELCGTRDPDTHAYACPEARIRVPADDLIESRTVTTTGLGLLNGNNKDDDGRTAEGDDRIVRMSGLRTAQRRLSDAVLTNVLDNVALIAQAGVSDDTEGRVADDMLPFVRAFMADQDAVMARLVRELNTSRVVDAESPFAIEDAASVVPALVGALYALSMRNEGDGGGDDDGDGGEPAPAPAPESEGEGDGEAPTVEGEDAAKAAEAEADVKTDSVVDSILRMMEDQQRRLAEVDDELLALVSAGGRKAAVEATDEKMRQAEAEDVESNAKRVLDKLSATQADLDAALARSKKGDAAAKKAAAKHKPKFRY